MPYVDLHPPSGPIKAFYYISTPESHNADEIIPGIPTVLFLHPTGMSSYIFESQWADPALRELNLIAFDMRAHGLTLGRLASGPIDVMEDVRHFMDALDIGSCHVFALGITCDTALELASKYPQRVLSMTLCSPFPKQDENDVIKARVEVFQRWRDAFSFLPSENGQGSTVVIDRETINEALAGVKQFTFNMSDSPLAKAVTDITVAQWTDGVTPETLNDSHRVVVELLQYRQRITVREMAKIQSPVLLLYFNGDIVYPVDGSQELLGELTRAGVSASLMVADGSHYGCLLSASEINGKVQRFIQSCDPEGKATQSTTSPVVLRAERMRSGRMKTAFYNLFLNVGYDPEDHYSEVDPVFTRFIVKE